jgi:hypothetical protein
MRRRAGIVVALLTALAGAWTLGGAGKGDLVRALRTAESHNDLLEARVSVLRARVSLDAADFGEMDRQLERARMLVGRAGERRGPDGSPLSEELRRLDLGGIDAEIAEAHRLVQAVTSGAARARTLTVRSGR